MTDRDTFETDCNATIAALARGLQERHVEHALVTLAHTCQTDVVGILEALARILARTAEQMGDSPRGGMLAYHALAAHAVATSLEDAMLTAQNAVTTPTSWA